MAQTTQLAATETDTKAKIVDNAEPAWAAILKPFAASMVRKAFTAGGAVLVAKGFADSAGATQLVGALMVIASIAWSYLTQRGAALMSQALSDAVEIMHARAEAARATQANRQNTTGG